MLKKVTDWVTCDLMEVSDWREKVTDGRICDLLQCKYVKICW